MFSASGMGRKERSPAVSFSTTHVQEEGLLNPSCIGNEGSIPQKEEGGRKEGRKAERKEGKKERGFPGEKSLLFGP